MVITWRLASISLFGGFGGQAQRHHRVEARARVECFSKRTSMRDAQRQTLKGYNVGEHNGCNQTRKTTETQKNPPWLQFLAHQSSIDKRSL